MRVLALPAIRFYQRRLSPYKGFCCAYRAHTGRASCSALGLRVIRRFGFLGGIALLRQRLKLCGVAHRRYGSRLLQRGSCDAPCDLPCDGDCNLDCGKPSKYFSCCDGCSCDWPERKKRKRSDEEKYVYIPPQSGKR